MDAIRVAKVENVRLEEIHGGIKRDLTGILHLTTHHLLFCSPGSPEIWTPYPLINQATRLPQTLLGVSPLLIRTRTFEALLLNFPKGSEKDADEVYLSIRELTVANSVEQLYAFYYQPTPPLYDPSMTVGPGWTIFNPREEFARMGVGSRTKAWRFTDINKDYHFSPTYPGKMVVPAKISDAVLVYAGKYRSKARIPALTYLHWANHASITRCSQPLVGIKNSRSPQDERLVDSIFQSHISPDTSYSPAIDTPSRTPAGSTTPIYGATSTNLIVDARPTANAVANVAKGAGTENMEYYKAARKAYLGIENIHVMRDSLNKLTEALRDAEPVAMGQNGMIGGGFVDRIALRRSNWLKHVSAILDGALIIVKNVHINSSHVLIHCSDGWDRTSQLAAIAELCLDPYYRTFKGFAVLVEKDFLAFGHKFLDRCGHLSPDKLNTAPITEDDGEAPGGAERAAQAFIGAFQKQFQSSSHAKEISPVFHQFLDCVWQLLRQFPERFEFSGEFLAALHYQLYACQHGTFLFNTEKQRRTIAVLGDDESGISAAKSAPWERTISVWDLLAQPSLRETHRNPQYDSTLDDPKRSPEADMGVLLPRPKDVKYWYHLFGRTDEEMNGRMVTEQAQGVEVIGPISNAESDPVLPFPVVAKVAEEVATAKTGQEWMTTRSAENSSPQPGRWSNVGYGVDNNVGSGPYGSAPKSPLRSNRNQLASSTSTSTSSSSGGGGGWGWSQFNSSAISAMNVLQGAAREVKSLGVDVLGKVMSEEKGEGKGEMWVKEGDGSSGAANGVTRGSQLENARVDTNPWSRTRIPSEANPWSTMSAIRSSTQPATSTIPPPSMTILLPPEQTQTQPPPPPTPLTNSSNIDYLASPSQTWASTADRRSPGPARSSIPMSSPKPPADHPLPPSRAESVHVGLDQLSLGATHPPRNDTVLQMQVNKEQQTQKTWDPLGVL